MPVIGQRNYILPPTTDTFVSLANEEFTRKLDLTGFGNSWSKIKIGISCAIADTGGGNIANTQFFVGLSSGTAFPFGSISCVHAVGWMFGSAAATWTYNAGAGNPYYSAATFRYLRRVGVTETNGTVGSVTISVPTTAGSLQRRGFIEVMLAQAATTVAFNAYSEAAATAASDVSFEQFMYSTSQGIGGSGTPYVLEVQCVGGVAQSLTPGAGWNTNVLDTLDIYWSNPTYSLEIYAIATQFTS